MAAKPDKIFGIAKVDFCNVHDVAKSVIQQLNYRGVSGSKFFACERDNVRFLLKMAFHVKSLKEQFGHSAGKHQSSTEAEILALDAIKKHISDAGFSPCALDLVYYKTCDMKTLLDQITCEDVMTKVGKDDNLTAVERAICRHSELIKAGAGLPTVSFLVLDRCDMTLGEFLNRLGTAVDVAILKSLLFEIIHFFAVFQLLWPGARHRDLHTDNVMLKIDPAFDLNFSAVKFLEFSFPVSEDEPDDVFYVPFFGFYAKVIDFGFARIPELGIESAVKDDPVMLSRRADNDLVFLLHWIFHATRSSPMSKQVDQLLGSIDPTKSYTHYYVPAVDSAEVPTPAEMLRGRTWREYRKKPGQIFAKYETPRK